MTPAKQDTNVGTGCLAALVFLTTFVTLAAVLIPVAWNVGLEGAGIVANDIGYGTALGLAFCVLILRSIFAAGRNNRVQS